jgi:putative ABC transport system ATP-binding protein
MPVIEMRGIKRHYELGEVTVKALNGVDLRIDETEFVAVMGASGSGKSTLMNILGCLDQQTAGTYVLDGIDTSTIGADRLAEIRNEKIGFVFQGFNLLARTSALENVELPLLYARGDAAKRREAVRGAREKASRALERVGLGDRMNHVPTQLSGGQQQRVAIARALVNDPAIILADEPTGNLDSAMSLEIMGLFQELNDQGITVVMVTHEPDIAAFARRKVTVRDGLILADAAIGDRNDARLALAEWKEKHDRFLESGEAAK